MGCVEISQPTRNLSQEQRSGVAQECIRILSTGSGTGRYNSIIGNPSTDNVGLVNFKPIRENFTIQMYTEDDSEDADVIACNARDNISFVTVLEEQKPGAITYCAKDRVGFRACYVLECVDDTDIREIKLMIDLLFRSSRN